MKHIDISKLIKEEKLYSKWDSQNDCPIEDDDKLIDYLEKLVPMGGYIIDFHRS